MIRYIVISISKFYIQFQHLIIKIAKQILKLGKEKKQPIETVLQLTQFLQSPEMDVKIIVNVKFKKIIKKIENFAKKLEFIF